VIKYPNRLFIAKWFCKIGNGCVISEEKVGVAASTVNTWNLSGINVTQAIVNVLSN
jgi:hypothetical protein